MAVGVLIITHEGIGEALLATARSVFPQQPLAVRAFAIARDADPQVSLHQAIALGKDLDSGDGLLVLSDLYGSTPSNVASKVASGLNGRIVSGVNLPMLLRIFNYPDLTLTELAKVAVEGGRSGVVG